jgi:hypothetical protein
MDGEVATLEEFEKRYKDEWILIEVLEEDKLNNPRKGRLIAHSKAKDDVLDVSRNMKGNLCIFFAGEIPKKGYGFAF